MPHMNYGSMMQGGAMRRPMTPPGGGGYAPLPMGGGLGGPMGPMGRAPMPLAGGSPWQTAPGALAQPMGPRAPMPGALGGMAGNAMLGRAMGGMSPASAALRRRAAGAQVL